jgi:hypothetical protein
LSCGTARSWPSHTPERLRPSVRAPGRHGARTVPYAGATVTLIFIRGGRTRTGWSCPPQPVQNIPHFCSELLIQHLAQRVDPNAVTELDHTGNPRLSGPRDCPIPGAVLVSRWSSRPNYPDSRKAMTARMH